MNSNVRTVLNYVISAILALLLAFILITILLLWQKCDPIKTFSAMFGGAFGNWQNFSSSLVLATPLMLGGLGITLSFRCGIFNIGGEGQLYLGALAATFAGVYLTGLPSVLHIAACLLLSMILGGLWALIPGYLKISRGYNEIITSVLLNYVGVYFVNYTLSSFFKAGGTLNYQSPQILDSAKMTKLLSGSELNSSFLLAIAIMLIFFFLFYRTDLGFKLRAVGSNMEAARTAGINTKGYLLTGIMISGALAGMAGAVQILGYQYVLQQNFSPNTGYDIIGVALMGNLNVFGVGLAAILIGALRNGATMVQILEGVPVTILYIIQGTIILSIIGFSRAKLDYIGWVAKLFRQQPKCGVHAGKGEVE